MVREVREEVGLDVVVTGLLGIWMDTYGPPAGSAPPDATLNCYFVVACHDAAEPQVDTSESSEAAWFDPDGLPDALAFPDHARHVLDAWRAMVASASDSEGADAGPA